MASHPILSRDEHFMGFLQQKDGWRESVKETGILLLRVMQVKINQWISYIKLLYLITFII